MEHRGPTRRRRRSAADARTELVEAAVLELEEVGVEQLSLRGIARRVGVSHQSVAYHFADRSALFTEVAIAGFEELTALMRRGLDELDPASALGVPVASVGKTYVDFARANRARFELMFRSGLIAASDERLQSAQAEQWQLLLGTVAEATRRGWADYADAERMALGCWALVHGLATLEGNFALPPVSLHSIIDLFNRVVAKPAPDVRP